MSMFWDQVPKSAAPKVYEEQKSAIRDGDEPNTSNQRPDNVVYTRHNSNIVYKAEVPHVTDDEEPKRRVIRRAVPLFQGAKMSGQRATPYTWRALYELWRLSWYCCTYTHHISYQVFPRLITFSSWFEACLEKRDGIWSQSSHRFFRFYLFIFFLFVSFP